MTINLNDRVEITIGRDGPAALEAHYESWNAPADMRETVAEGDKVVDHLWVIMEKYGHAIRMGRQVIGTEIKLYEVG